MNPADANFPLRILSEDLVRGLLTAIWGIKATGLENVPLTGPLIIAANHASLVDAPLVAAVIAPRRRPFAMGKRELFENPILGWWLRRAGAFPIDRRGDAISALRRALDVLEKGGCLAIYPEGTRVKPGQRRAPKAGVAFLSARTGAPVVPVRVLGTGISSKIPARSSHRAPLAPPRSEDRRTGLAYAKMLMENIYCFEYGTGPSNSLREFGRSGARTN